MSIEILQFNSFAPFLEGALRDRFQVHRWFEIADPGQWLKDHGARVRAIVTAANIGVPSSVIESLPALGIIAISGVGFDKVDLGIARSRGVRVSYTPDVLTDDVADLALGLIIALLRDLPAADRHVREGQWPAAAMPLGRKVTGLRFGILGLGRIGSAVARRLAVLGPVAYHAPSQKAQPYRFVADPIELARESDVLVVAVSANPSTQGIVGAAMLDALGPAGYLVNVARGYIVDEQALIGALLQKRIAGAALDVFADEPNVPASLRSLPNVVLTPHIGSATHETRENMARMVLASLDAFFSNAPVPSTLV